MKVLAASLLLACFPSLANANRYATIHDFCVDPKNAAHYSSYDECYRDSKASEKRVRVRKERERENKNQLYKNLGKAFSNLKPYGYGNHPPTTTTCTTNFGTTTCTTE